MSLASLFQTTLLMEKIILYFFAPFFICNTLYGQTKAVKLDSLFHSLYETGKFNGNILVAEKGKILYQNSFGIANELTKEKLNTESIFELASVTKQFTAMGIVILKEKGKLSYDDKIGKYIPALNFFSSITIKNLLQHTSGLPDYMQLLDSLLIDSTWDSKTKIATNKDIIAVYAKHKPKLLFQPGTKWEYSNTGYALLASIIESISKKKYADFLKENIFEPLQMTNTFVYTRRLHPKAIKNYAYGYVYSDSLKINLLPDAVPPLDLMVFCLDGVVGDGTVNSTTTDLFKWDRALYTEKLISSKSRSEVFTSGMLENKTATDYGFGWGLEKSELFGNIAKHSGGWPGYRTYIERHLDNDKTIILLENHDNARTVMPVKEIRDILYDIEPLKIIQVDIETLKKYAGLYKTAKGDEKEFIIKNDKLFVIINPQVQLELMALTATKFIVKGFTPEVQIDFFLENGIVTKHIATQEGKKFEALKLK